ncbi:MAG: glucose-1-phosphate adenylyltransferase subunit GlgD [Clostridia bacterium]|nr:glucose-1-phosphate adenylyltransferase subunit GlgD [Clostridia bacterium]
MTAAGLIFSNIHNQSIPELTKQRTMASIPFGCRYRLIDFALSNMVNSDISTVGVITHNNYQSLMDHLGTGKDWDLARRSGGIKLLPPFVSAHENRLAGKLYENRLEATVGAANFIRYCKADYMVLSDCDAILNIDFKEVIADHIRSGAFLTLVGKRVDVKKNPIACPVDLLTVDSTGRLTDFEVAIPKSGKHLINTNIMVVRRTDLLSIIDEAIAKGYKSFHDDVMRHGLRRKLFHVYEFDGWYEQISSLESYFDASMALLTKEAQDSLLSCPDRQIYTKVRNSPPTKYAETAKVTNSLIGDGCIIEGTVDNCILFRGVRVGHGAVLKNCILMQDTYVGDRADLNCVITDKNAVIKDGRRLSGHETMPFFIGKGQMV